MKVKLACFIFINVLLIGTFPYFSIFINPPFSYDFKNMLENIFRYTARSIKITVEITVKNALVVEVFQLKYCP